MLDPSDGVNLRRGGYKLPIIGRENQASRQFLDFGVLIFLREVVMDIEWLIDNEKYLKAIVKDYQAKETELFNKFKAAIVKEKRVGFSSDSFVINSDNFYYSGKNWKIRNNEATFNGEKILSKDYIKELQALASSVWNNQLKA